jgi:hypothetical protein
MIQDFIDLDRVYLRRCNMNKTNLLIDIALLIAFLISSSPNFTGNLIHEWLGVALAIALIMHILLHWNWIVSVGTRYLKNLWHVSRLQFFVDVLIFLVFITLITTGLMMSKTALVALGIQVARAGRSVKTIHSTASNVAMILAGVHVALHWKWIVCTIKAVPVTPVGNLFNRPSVMSTTETNQA